jgi:hypothetical protein
MAPNKQPPVTAASAVASGNTLLTDFFKRKRRGRPKKSGNMASDNITVSKAKRRGPVPAGSNKRKPSPPRDSTTNLENASAQVQPPEMRVVKRRTNWGQGEGKISMEKAVSEWDGKTGRALDSNGEEHTLRVFSGVVGIPYDTLKKYVRSDAEKRRVIGNSGGRAPLLKKENQTFVADVLARKDRVNEGATPAEAIDLVQELNPTLSRDQARRHLNRTLIPAHPQKLKLKP